MSRKTTASLLTTPTGATLITDLLCSISSNGECAAVCTPDGVIKFYDTLTSSLKQEYASSTHLQASCSCLSWSVHGSNSSSSSSQQKNNKSSGAMAKQKKLKAAPQNIESELNDLNLIAIGTAQGAILLYSLTKGALHSQLVILLNEIVFLILTEILTVSSKELLLLLQLVI